MIEKIDKEGYVWVKELGIDLDSEDEKQPIILENCAHKERFGK